MDANLLNNSDKYYQQELCEFESEIQDVLMKDQAVYFIHSTKKQIQRDFSRERS